MGNIDKMIAFANSKWHKVKYDMGVKRVGPACLDCSSFVFYCLIAGEFLEKNTRIGNTEDLYLLKGKIFDEIYSYDEVQRGDIFIRGYQGKSAGRYGHTGIFLRKDEIIHCNALNDTVTINNESSFVGYFLDRNRSSFERYFRPRVSKENGDFRKIKDEIWRAKALEFINIRENPNRSSKILGTVNKGEIINYDSVYEADNHRWISYINNYGKRCFVAYRDLDGNQWMDFR